MNDQDSDFYFSLFLYESFLTYRITNDTEQQYSTHKCYTISTSLIIVQKAIGCDMYMYKKF